MRRVSIILALTLIAAVSAPAQEHDHAGARATSGSIHKAAPKFDVSVSRGRMTSLPNSAMGYLSLPDDKGGKHPAIIVIQEWWGMNEWILQQTDRFAKQGYVALAVDLYRGKATSDPEVAHELMRGLPEDRAISDLKSGFAFLAARSDVDPARIGVIGWCMGGGYSLGLALAEPRVAATVMNYGRLVTDPATIAKIDAPLLGNFGALDRGIPPADVEAFDAALKKAGKSSDIKIYDGAGHGFMNPNNKDGYVAGAADDAWGRIDSFFAKRLKP
jgi:carboxymethylenebutenolidase